jgi:hypothetical protein
MVFYAGKLCDRNISAHLYNGYKMDLKVDTVNMHMGSSSMKGGALAAR